MYIALNHAACNERVRACICGNSTDFRMRMEQGHEGYEAHIVCGRCGNHPDPYYNVRSPYPASNAIAKQCVNVWNRLMKGV